MEVNPNEGEGATAKLMEGEKWLKAAMGWKVVIVLEFIEVEESDFDDKNRNGKTALISAARNGHHVVVNVLVQAGAGVDVVTNDGGTSLHYAVYQDRLEV